MEEIGVALKKIYSLFHDKYGPQGWWPLLSLHQNNSNPLNRGVFKGYHPQDYSHPETDKDKFEIMLGALLTQNTSWVNAEKALLALQENELLEPHAILKETQEKIGELIKPSGYFNQKSERLQIISQFILDNPIEDLEQLDVAELRKILIKIKGIGSETADSIILYAFKKPIFVVDTYTKRIFSRYGMIEPKAKYEVVQELLHSNLESSHELFNEYHALIVEHAVRHCSTKPICEGCVLESMCAKKIVKRKKKGKQKNSNLKS